MHAFDEAVALQPLPDGTLRGHTHPAWANMVGPFGGITAAQLLQAVLQSPGRLGEPVALTLNFCAALADGPFDVQARALRTNRSTQHWAVELRQGGEVMASATAVTALRREAWADDEHTMPAVPPPDTLPRVTGTGSVAWLQRYDLRLVAGPLPQAWDGGEHPDSTTLQWMRDDPPRPLCAASLTALCDVFYPRVWRRRATPVPVGTVSMTVYYHADAATLAATGSAHVLGRAQGQAFRAGFFDQAVQLWNAAGTLLATSHQVVYYRA